METVQGRVPMPDPLKILTPPQLLILYGMLERGSYRIQHVGHLSGWPSGEWLPLMAELNELAYDAYDKLWSTITPVESDQAFMYMTPMRREWELDIDGESD